MITEERKKILSFILILYEMIFSSHTLIFGTNENYFFVYTQYLVIPFVGILSIILLAKSTKYNLLSILTALFLSTTVLITSLINKDYDIRYFVECCLMISSLLFVSAVDFKIFKKIYINVLYLLTVIGLIEWLIATFFPDFVLLFPSVINSAGNVFYCMGFVNIHSQSSRYYGLAREPAVAIIYLMIALLFLLEKKGFKILKSLVFSFAIIVSYSTTGIIALLCYWLGVLVYFRETKYSKLILFVMILGLGYLIFNTNILELTGPVFNKFLSSNDSLNSRIGSFLIGFYLFFSSPFFGNGWAKAMSIIEQMSSNTLTTHFTNTILYLFAWYGIFWGVFFTVGLFLLVYKKKCLAFTLGSYLIILIILSGSRLTYDFLLYILSWYGYKLFCKPELSAEENKIIIA
ncbi:hypothetical protein [uncultured Bacteroides sp.]|uniref:hypothetical protein n=1 Tax=uncultured Bacteroides sp. TaxID=162156 RepID=UPI002618D1AA|nr:hypothetical protein [uncultured Bacteroides sp.]